MKGIIFNLLEDVVHSNFGPDAWDDMIENARVSGVYTSLGNYPHGELLALIDEFSARHASSRDELLVWFGRHAIPLLAERYADFFVPHERLKPFLLTLNDVIHSEVRKLYPGGEPPVFLFESPADDDDAELLIRYRSRRKLCKLAEGFTMGAADYFGETVTVEQTQCMLDGEDECRLLCSFAH